MADVLSRSLPASFCHELDMIRRYRPDGAEEFSQQLLSKRKYRSGPETPFWPTVAANGYVW
jgi:hypothetical protein